MAYTPTTWATGDTITAAKMNKIEQGIAEGGTVIITDTNGTLNKTFAEIYNLIFNGVPCYILYRANISQSNLDGDYNYDIELFPIVAVYKYDVDYRIMATSTTLGLIDNVAQGTPSNWTYQVSSSQEYPTFLRKAFNTNINSNGGHYLTT